MPGYVIHLAVAEEYLRIHSESKEAKEKKEYEQFIQGVIYPDSMEDKSITHYGPGSSFANIYKFLKDKDIKTSFNRGYFLHLVTDYLFYNRYIQYFSKAIYTDYDLSNKKLIELYKVQIPDNIKDKIFYKDGSESEMKIFTMDLIKRFIEETGKLDIDDVAEDAIKNPEKWTRIRPLIKI